MNQYSKKNIEEAKNFRIQGKTYQEINEILGITVPKSTYSYWFKGVIIPEESQKKLLNSIDKKLVLARQKAVNSNKVKRNKYLSSLDEINFPFGKRIHDREIAKVALAMLCLGEASKSSRSPGFYLGNSDPRIIKLFIELLKRCFPIVDSKFRFTIQCRSDQNLRELESYWRGVLGITDGRFYPPRIDPRTLGKPTKNSDYKGVLRVDYLDRNIQLELESLAQMIYNQVC